MDCSPKSSSREKASHLSSSPDGDPLLGWPYHFDHALERPSGPSQTRETSHIPRTAFFPSETPPGPVTDSSINAIGDPFGVNTYLSEIDRFQSLTSPNLPPYFDFGSQPFQQQNRGAADSTKGTSVSYTATDGTYSPRSFGRQELADVDDGSFPNSNHALESFFSDCGDLGHGCDNDWQNTSFEGLALPGSQDLVGTHLLPGLAIGVEDVSLSFADRHSENLPGETGNPSAATSIHLFNEFSSPGPQPQALLVEPRTDNSSMGEAFRQTASFAKNLQAAVPRGSKFREIKPRKRSSATSPTLLRSISIQGTQDARLVLSSRTSEKLPLRAGIRKGPLSKAQARHAKKVRKRGACFLCRFQNVKCSLLDTCERCARMRPSLMQSSNRGSPTPLSTLVLCFWSRLEKYTAVMFPDFVTLRFKEDRMSALVKKTARFTDNLIPVEMTSGPDYPPIPFIATEFHCLDPKFLALEYIIPNKDTVNQCQIYTTSYAPPIALYGVGSVELRSKCLAHIESIISKNRDIGEANYGDTSIITHEVLEAVNEYRRSIPGGGSILLKKAVMIHSMQYFMSRIITLSKTSAEAAVGSLRRPQPLPFDEALQVSKVLTSTLLNLQVKQAMLGLLQEMTVEVLQMFEKAILKARDGPTPFTDNFCITLILCMCFEAVQVSNDSVVMALIRKDPNCKYDRAQTFFTVENGPFMELMCLFHAAYKTNKATGPNGPKYFNPVRYGFPIHAQGTITPQMRILVNKVKNIMKKNDSELAKANQVPSFHNPQPDILTHHMFFRKQNSGRLVARFLLSFFE